MSGDGDGVEEVLRRCCRPFGAEECLGQGVHTCANKYGRLDACLHICTSMDTLP